MQKLLRFFLLLALLVPACALAQREVVVEVTGDRNSIPVRVSANTPELDLLAKQAFGAHGRYRLDPRDYAYDIKFSLVTPTQVRVDITKGRGGVVFSSDVATGSSARNALLRAADIAVTKTSGIPGLKGFFTARLAFIRDQGRVKEICTSDLFFGEVKQITHDNALALTPRWAPDGSRILYTSFYKSGFPDIFQIDLGSFQRTLFASFRGTNSGAHFSPNGQEVAMVLTGTGTPEIWVGNAQGHGLKQRTRSDAVKSSPCFSPDSARLVFAMEPGPRLHVMSTGGGTPQLLNAGFNYVAEPDWSHANPNLIACTVRSGRGYQIAVYDFSKGKAEVVSKAPFDGVEPCWLADGRHVIYTARTAAESRLCILDTETGKSVPISPESFGSASQASTWTP